MRSASSSTACPPRRSTTAAARTCWGSSATGTRCGSRITRTGGSRQSSTIDGRDVVNGRAGEFRNRGYLIEAWGSVDIDGWRISAVRSCGFSILVGAGVVRGADRKLARGRRHRGGGVPRTVCSAGRHPAARPYAAPYRKRESLDDLLEGRAAPSASAGAPPAKAQRSAEPAGASAPSLASRCRRTFTRSNSYAPIPRAPLPCLDCTTTTVRGCWRWGSPSTANRRSPRSTGV